MTTVPIWLPPLVCLEDFGGTWQDYVAAIYSHFCKDFVESRPLFGEHPVQIKRHPLLDNKEATFWHIISEGPEEEQRTPDLRRCERIRWPRPVIEHDTDSAVRYWQNKRGKEKRIVLWLYDSDYVVVLAVRKGYVVLWTAYPVSWSHTRKKLMKEYLEWHK